MRVITETPAVTVERPGFRPLPSLLLEGVAADVRKFDRLADRLKVTSVASADHYGVPALRFGITIQFDGSPACDINSGRLILTTETELVFRRVFASESEKQKFLDDLNLPEGCTYIKARMLEVGQIIYVTYTNAQTCHTITDVEILSGSERMESPMVKVNLSNPGTGSKLFEPDEKVIVKKQS